MKKTNLVLASVGLAVLSRGAVRITNEGAPYAFVEAVPDRGTVRITKSAL